MAFLDNSGDIILDAVLTDTGRARLAKGDGTFRIVKFALGDDEIDYTTYRNSNHSDGAHASGSAYYDLDILQTPVLEAFTNNTSLLKSKLLSVPRTNLLYLPVLKLQKTTGATNTPHEKAEWNATDETFYVTADRDTKEAFEASGVAVFQNSPGVIDGTNGSKATIAIHQGLDTTEISHMFEMDADLFETQYIIEMDNRLGNITSHNGQVNANLSFIDDDNIASYFLSLGTDGDFVKGRIAITDQTVRGDDTGYPVRGPQGSRLILSLKSSLELRTSTYLFTKLGQLTAHTNLAGLVGAPAGNYYYIDTYVRITGATTGYRLDVPIRFVRQA